MLYKKSEIFLHWLFIKLEKLHFEPTSDLFWSKNFKTELFAEKTIYNNFKFLCHSSFMQKLRNVPCIDFWHHQNLKNLKTSVNFKHTCYCNLMQKKEKNCECHFLIKLLFWAHFDPKTFQSDFSPRNHFGQFKGFALL